MSIKVDSIYIVRKKKLRGNRVVTRSAVTVKAVNTASKTVGDVEELTVTFNHPKLEGPLMGKLYTKDGTIEMDSSTVQLKGYLKSRGFKVVGFDLSASRVNTNKRKTGNNNETV